MNMQRMQWACGLLLAGVLLFLAACGSPSPPATTGETNPPQPTVADGHAPSTGQAVDEAPTSAPAAEGTEPPLPAATATLTDTVLEPEGAQRGLLINITTDDTWSANMAIGLAQRAVDQEVAPVIIFLNVRGVYLGDRERLPATEGNSEQTIHEKLQAFVAAGGQVIACPSCSQEAGLTQADYLEGVVVGEPGDIVPFLTDPNITVISYTGRSHHE